MLRLKDDVSKPICISALKDGQPARVVSIAEDKQWVGRFVQRVYINDRDAIIEIGGGNVQLTEALNAKGATVVLINMTACAMPGVIKLKDAKPNQLYVVVTAGPRLAVGEIIQRTYDGEPMIRVIGGGQEGLQYHNGYDNVEVRAVPPGSEFVYT